MSIPLLYTSTPSPTLHFEEPSGPAEKCALVYLNEGGANIVFGILQDEGPVNALTGKLLRLPKDLPHVQNATAQLAAYNEHFQPLFPAHHLVQHELVALANGVASHITEKLSTFPRPTNRQDDFLDPEQDAGLLVTDMTPRKGDVILELKPKWLAQSPNAPPGAKRCRTCAIRASRASAGVRTATDIRSICPLGLISDDEAVRMKAVRATTQDDFLRKFLMHDAQANLRQLRHWQTELDKHGVLSVRNDDSISDLCKAMTIRDCTLYVRGSDNDIEARLADLDLKQPQKLSSWRQIEQNLVEGGWYTNTESQRSWAEETLCILSR